MTARKLYGGEEARQDKETGEWRPLTYRELQKTFVGKPYFGGNGSDSMAHSRWVHRELNKVFSIRSGLQQMGLEGLSPKERAEIRRDFYQARRNVIAAMGGFDR